MSGHVGSRKVYVVIFLALMCFTGLTITAAFMNLGMFNAPIALFIATCKMLLVVLFFMHVKDSPRLTKTIVICGFFWLSILLTLTMTDFLTRVWE